MNRSTFNRLRCLLVAAALGFSAGANAAFVTTQEAKLDQIFSQSSFGATPVDIRIGAVTTFVMPTLLDITTDLEVSQLFALHTGGANVVNFYFIDTIDRCGGVTNVNFIGCGETPGNDFVVESVFAADANFGGNLLAHELAHNLGLGHEAGSGTNLMNPVISTNFTLTEAQVAGLLTSPRVQTDGNGSRFVMINPVLILAAAVGVPVPATTGLLLAGLLAIGARRRIAAAA